MQTFVSNFSFIIILVALAVQMLWMSLARRARDTYLRDLVSFRRPSTSLSRYYNWRMESIRNSIIDGIVFVSVLLVTVLLMVYVSIPTSEFMLFLPIILFVVGISVLSAVHSSYRVNESNKEERDLVSQLEPATDKISFARDIALSLIRSGKKDSGKTWYVLYRIAQRQDTVGWSVRDVLLDKGLRDEVDSLEPGAPSRRYGSRDPDTGPGIS